MPNSTIADPRAWRAESVGEPGAWYHRLSEPALAALERFLTGDQPVTDLRPDAALAAALAADVASIRAALEEGRGFVVVTPGAPGRYGPDALARIYWLLGQLLGRPVVQNVQGTILYDVRDTGQDVRYGARFSVTNAESSFHTDSSFMETVTDYVGLLCLNGSKSGGLSQVVSGQAVREQLLTAEPAAWQQLTRPFHVDRRGGVRPGEEPTVRYPVFGESVQGLLIRYLRYWIEAGHEKAGVPLSTDQIAALDALDRTAADPGMRAEFALRPGDMFFVNNRWILHNRTAYEDHSEPDSPPSTASLAGHGRVNPSPPPGLEVPPRLGLDRVGLVLGPALMLAWFTLADPGTLSPEAFRLAGILMLTLVWWITEPIPIPATGLLAAVLCVVLGAVPAEERAREGVRTVLAPFADPTVFFLLGGLFIGRAMTQHGLDRRLALAILASRWAARTPGTLLATVGAGTTFISMWISNTAAAAMMCPVVVGIIAVLAADPGIPGGSAFSRSRYASALLLITAFGASVGGIATPIGTATNMLALGFLKRPEVLGQGIDFLHWTAVGVPAMVLIFLGMYAWVQLLAPAGDLNLALLRAHLRAEYQRLGPWKRGEVNTFCVFLIAVGLWVAPGVLAVAAPAEVHTAFLRRFPEEMTALLAVALLFLLPTDLRGRRFTLEGEDFRLVDWGTILLFGAALSLGGLMFRTGLAEAAGRAAFGQIGSRDLWVLTGVAIGSAVLLSEVTSNTATAAALLPVVHRLCLEAGVDPLPPLLGVTLGASFGSSLPVSTPPNAIVYGTGMAPVRRMIPAGLGLDLVAAIVIWAVLWFAREVAHWSPLAARLP